MSVFLLSALLQQSSIGTDARLTKMANFDASLVPIQRFMKEASEKAGIPLRAVPAVYDLKIDAYVDNQQIGVTLAKLAEVLDLQWEPEGNGYKLVVDVTKSNREKAYMAEEDRLALRFVDKEIAIYRLMDSLIPRSAEAWPDQEKVKNRFADWIPKRDQALKAILDSADKKLTEDERISMDIQFEALNRIAAGFPNLQLARLFAKMNSKEIDAFRAGTPFIASNYPNSRFNFSQGDVKPFVRFTGSDGKRIETKAVVLTRLNPVSKRFGYKELTYGEGSIGLSGEAASQYPFDGASPYLAKLAFAVDLKAWNQFENLEDLYKEPMDINAEQSKAWPSPWYSHRFRLGDHLRWFHRATGVPVIAPANRTTHPFVRLIRPANSRGAYLKPLLAACGGFAHKSDQFLLVRDGLYWRKRAHEIPEDAYAGMENLPKGRKLTLMDYAVFSTKITRTQAALLQNRSSGFTTTFPTINFSEAFPALQFLGKLSSSQAVQASTDEGLQNQVLSSELKNQFMTSVIEGIMENGWVSEPLLKSLISKGFDPDSVGNMYFHLAKTKTSMAYGADFAFENGQAIELSPSQNYTDRPTVRFEFGYDPKNVITFSTEDF